MTTIKPPEFYPLFAKPARKVDRVFIHCSASSNPKHATIEEIESWHIKRKFSEIGYHYLINFDGDILHGRSLEKMPSAQKGRNRGTIAICLSGLLVTDFKLTQIDALNQLCAEIDYAYEHNITFHGHCEVSTKKCPVFDYKKYLNLSADGKYNDGEFYKHRLLQTFDTGVDVVEIQRKLNVWLLGSGRPGIRIDGIYGAQTTNAVTDFQIENDFPPTGMVDSITRMKLPPIPKRSRGIKL